MPQAEISFWLEYRRRRGSLNVGRRVEQAIAQLFANYFNSKVKASDRIDPIKLMPHEDQPEELVISIDEAMERGF